MDPMALTSRLVSVVTLGVFCAFTAAASPIPVLNFSFEAAPTPTGFNKICGTNCVFSTGQAIPDWTGGSGRGELRLTALGNTAVLSFVPLGTTVGFTTSGTLSQTVLSTVQLNFTYTLLVELGFRNDLGAGSRFTAGADLLINGHTYVAAGNAPGPGGWSLYTATYTGLLKDVGKPITIQLTSVDIAGTSEAIFDNVQLSAVAPEPAGVTLLGLGLAGLLVLARRQRAG